MDLKKYKELTGVTVPTSQEVKVTATIRRTKATLETMLGFSLKPKNLYIEKGKVQYEGYFPIEDTTELLAPDEEVGTYKLFPFNESDQYFHVDPFENIYKVKLVKPVTDGEFVTIAQLDNVVPTYGRDRIGKYIERHYEWFTWEWWRTWRYTWKANGDDGLMLAVEADWIDCYPDDLLYLWADMVTYRTSPNYGISGESVDGHSWSRTKDHQVEPEYRADAKKILMRYAGPYGQVNKVPVR